MNKRVIVAGHVCIDIMPVFPPAAGGAEATESLLQPGKLIHMQGVEVHTGGAVANTGLALGRLGARARLIGKIGNDAFGGMVSALLCGEGADCRLITDATSATSYSVVLAMPGVDRIFLHDPGANDAFYADDVSDDMLEDAALFHFGYPPLMRSMYENGGRELVSLMRRAKKKGLITSLDMAAIDPNAGSGRADWVHILKETLPHVDHFLPSAEELCYMLDRERLRSWTERAAGRAATDVLDMEADISPLADRLIELGASNIVIKCGAAGMYYLCGGKRGFVPSFRPKQFVSATGAGDASIAGYIAALLQDLPPEECVRYAAAGGACSVSGMDAISGLLPFDTLRRLLDAGWSHERYPEAAL